MREGTPAELPQFGWLINTKDTENQCMNFIGKFENLQEDFDTICDKIGIPNNNFHTKMLQNTNTTPNTTMTKLVQLLRKNTQKTLSISDTNLEIER